MAGAIPVFSESGLVLGCPFDNQAHRSRVQSARHDGEVCDPHFVPAQSAGNGIWAGFFLARELGLDRMTRRVVGFVDGQNLFYAAKQAFGYTYPNFDPRRLTEVVAEAQGWTVAGIRFYTGVPDRSSGGR